MIAQAILAILLASAMAATFVGRRSNNALSQGLAKAKRTPITSHNIKIFGFPAWAKVCLNPDSWPVAEAHRCAAPPVLAAI